MTGSPSGPRPSTRSSGSWAPGRSGSRSSAVTPTWTAMSSSRPSRRPASTGTSPPSSAKPGSSTACKHPGIIHLYRLRVRRRGPEAAAVPGDRPLPRQPHPGRPRPSAWTADPGRPAAGRRSRRRKPSRRPMTRASGTATSSRPTCSSARRRGAGRSRSSTSACRSGAAWSRPRRRGPPAWVGR